MVGLVFNLNGSVKLYRENENAKVLPASFIVLSQVAPLMVEVFHPIDSIIVKFKTSVLSRLYGIDLSKVQGCLFIEYDLFNGISIVEQLKSISDSVERIQYLESYFRASFGAKTYVPDEIDKVYNTILNSDGRESVNNIVSGIDTNNRTFRRNFVKRTGISAKKLLRIVRINYIYEIINSKEKCGDVYTLAYLGGFFDHAHFIKDFKDILGETPKSFLARNLESVRYISGKQDMQTIDASNLADS